LNHGFSFDDLQCRQSFDGLGDQLHDTRDGRLASALVQSYLLKYYSQQELPFLLKDMSPVANHIVKQKGMVQVKQLENKFRVSGRWLEKQFNEQIGCSPKEYARITRFNALLFDLQKHPLNAFFSLMEDYGYYDQSHLIKDFRAFTGQTPGQYLAERHPDDAHVVYKWLG
jgi:AraC-like DNA-binding protein